MCFIKNKKIYVLRSVSKICFPIRILLQLSLRVVKIQTYKISILPCIVKVSKKYKNNDFRFPKKSLKKVFRMSKKRPQKHDSARWKLCGLGEYLLMSIADNEPIRKSASKQIRLNCVRDLFGNWLETFWKLVGDLLGTLKLSKTVWRHDGHVLETFSELVWRLLGDYKRL